jgi:hypothetical protein
MDFNEDEAPPPYSALDPMQTQSTNSSASTGNRDDTNHSANATPVELETSFSSLHIQAPSPSNTQATTIISPAGSETLPNTTAATAQSTHFTSAGGYFAEQPQPVPISGDIKLETLVHHMTIYARSQGKDFPRRPRCWNLRGSEINQHDWDTFLNFLFPSHLGPAASSNRLHRQTRAEIERDRKDRAQETDEQRSARINEVIAEWNEQFFSHRGVYVTYTYVADLEEGPASSLCPNCYPQATDASRVRGRLVRSRSDDAPIPAYTETAPVRQHTIQRRPVPQTAQAPSLPSPQNPRTSPASISPISASGHAETFPSMPFGDRSQAPSSWASNPASWATQMSSIAQQYAAKVSNQAQEYSRSIEASALARSRQVELYSKRVEDNALARARQLETMALTQGRRVENAGDALTNWASGIGKRGSGVSYAQSPNSPSTGEADRAAYETLQNQQRPQQRPRRLSTASDTSITSVSSIDTVSSVSDLEPEDLASVRQQLSSLNEYHHHELYDAAVSLRNQLQALKKARWNSRFRSQRSRPWGRWESPADAAQREQRRIAMKRETKLLREKFTEIDRRAKREVRELQKSKKEMRKKQRQEHHCYRAFRSQQQQHHTFPSNMDPYPNREYPIQSPESLSRASTEPARRSDSSQSNDPMPSQHPLDPHEAAKAWTESQRARVKEIKRANKERIKEIQKCHKEREKQQRKAIKKMNKQKPSLTMSLGSGSVASSSSLTLGETGTIRSSVSSSGISGMDNTDDGVSMHSISRGGSGSGRRGQGFGQQQNGVAESQTPELDGNPLGR